jgi:mannosyl-oligosaccharide alpha-1,2-mannosidase
MGFDELQPLSKHGADGLGGLGATVIDALDTAMIMGLSDIVKDAGSWIKKELPNRLNEKGQVVTLNSYLCLSCLRDTSETRSWQIADT